ncbi:helix-turn-helix transcriptional regulator [Kitasatospora sp. NPDC004723]|uniref:helix-turn-helix domain-containing protein n=1 Tax=Kitasatospora sp. NPDC004723 TaxID=3154288 RepID=UPI0033B0B3C6
MTTTRRGIGRRIAYWRGRRNLTQEEFGALMGGYSVRWVQDLEAEKRQQDPRLSVVERAARVLRIPMKWLIEDSPTVSCVDAVELDAIRLALHRHDVITGTADAASAGPLPIPELRRRWVHGRMAFQAGSFGSLGRVVPELLVEANRAAARYEGDDQRAALRLLSLTYGLTEAVSVKFGAPDLALIAGHRAVLAAERSEDPVVMASAARQLADAMTHQGQAAAGVDFALAVAARLESDLLARGAAGVSVLGMLYLKSAMAAAQVDSVPAARRVPGLLDQAAEHAALLGYDGNHVWTAFGPTNVLIHRVAASTALAEGGAAVAVALTIPDSSLADLPRERRAHHLADLAAAYVQAGRRPEAVDALLRAEREAPEEVRCRPRTRALVDDLRLLGAGAAEGRLRALAGRCGLAD